MQHPDLYSNAHLVIAAIRIFTHKNSKHPSMNEICKTLSFSLEQGNLICKKLKDLGIIDVIEGAFENHLFIKNHLKKFKDSKKDFSKKIESFQAKQAEKQKALFAELEEKLKKDSDKTKSSPE
jgi:hypothetical protein